MVVRGLLNVVPRSTRRLKWALAAATISVAATRNSRLRGGFDEVHERDPYLDGAGSPAPSLTPQLSGQ
jgi:hypothetical protein